MKMFFVKYGDFGNQYSLAYAESSEQAKHAEESGWERITRREAIQLAKNEIDRRKYDSNFAFFADCAIYPLSLYTSNFNRITFENSGYKLKNHIWEIIKK